MGTNFKPNGLEALRPLNLFHIADEIDSDDCFINLTEVEKYREIINNGLIEAAKLNLPELYFITKFMNVKTVVLAQLMYEYRQLGWSVNIIRKNEIESIFKIGIY